MKIYLVNMKKFFSALSVIITLTICVAVSILIISVFDTRVISANSEPITDFSKLIIIDAGHGGEDPGAVGSNGTLEKDLNLSISMLIGEELKNRGYTVIYTREEDKMLYKEEENIKGMRKLSDLKNRVKLIEKYKGATLVSIHMNSFGSAEYSGLQVYYKKGSGESENLANCIQSTVKEKLQNDNQRLVKEGNNIYLLEHSPINSVLIECGFLTNVEECNKLSEKEYQKQLSFAISCGIIKYIEG